MSIVLQKLKRYFKQFKGLFPSTLPTGVPQFESFIDELTETYDLPTKRRSDVAYVIATMIINSSTGSPYRSLHSFARAIRVAAAKQVAGNAFHEIQLAAKAAQQAAQTPVATTSDLVVANEAQNAG